MEGFDHMLRNLERILDRLDATQGSSVQMRKLELEMFEQLDVARNIMMAALQCEGGDRSALQHAFGGDCTRISRARVLLENVQHRAAHCECDYSNRAGDNGGRHWKASAAKCLSACECVEKVLSDLGLGLTLRKAQAAEADRKALLQKPRRGEDALDHVALQGVAPEETAVCSPEFCLANITNHDSLIAQAPEHNNDTIELSKSEESNDSAVDRAREGSEILNQVCLHNDLDNLNSLQVLDSSGHASLDIPPCDVRDSCFASSGTQKDIIATMPEDDVLEQASELATEFVACSDGTTETSEACAPMTLLNEEEYHNDDDTQPKSAVDAISAVLPKKACPFTDDVVIDGSGTPPYAPRHPVEKVQAETCIIEQDSFETEVPSCSSKMDDTHDDGPAGENASFTALVDRAFLKSTPPSGQDEVPAIDGWSHWHGISCDADLIDSPARDSPTTSNYRRKSAGKLVREKTPSTLRPKPLGHEQALALQTKEQEQPVSLIEDAKSTPGLRRASRLPGRHLGAPQQDGHRKSLPARPKESDQLASDARAKRKSLPARPTAPGESSSKTTRSGGNPVIRRHSFAGSLRAKTQEEIVATSQKINGSRGSPGRAEGNQSPNQERVPEQRSRRRSNPECSTPDRRTSKGQVIFPERRASNLSLPPHEDDELSIMEPLEVAERDVIKDLFALYVGPGGMSLGTGLSLSKFRRLLRDSGLVEDDQESIAALFPLSLPSQSQTRAKSVRDTSMWRAVSNNQADIILSRAANAVVDGQLSLKLMSPGSLALALSDVASYCRKSEKEAVHEPIAALQLLMSTVLGPLRDRLMSNKDDNWDAAAATEILSRGETSGVFQRSHRRLATIFASYAQGVGSAPPYRQGHWTAESLSRFASEFSLGKAFSNYSLRRLFDEVVDQEFQSGQGREDVLSFHGFQLCLTAIAERTLADVSQTPAERLRMILLRLNALTAQDLATFQRQ